MRLAASRTSRQNRPPSSSTDGRPAGRAGAGITLSGALGITGAGAVAICTPAITGIARSREKLARLAACTAASAFVCPALLATAMKLKAFTASSALSFSPLRSISFTSAVMERVTAPTPASRFCCGVRARGTFFFGVLMLLPSSQC